MLVEWRNEMGYSTRYTLDVKYISGEQERRNCPHEFPAESRFCPICGKSVGWTRIMDDILLETIPDYNIPIKDLINADCDGMKWYEHAEEMKRFSKKYPGFLFTLHGEGEEAGDIWNKYFVNGKIQEAKARVQIAEFDPNLLK